MNDLWSKEQLTQLHEVLKKNMNLKIHAISSCVDGKKSKDVKELFDDIMTIPIENENCSKFSFLVWKNVFKSISRHPINQSNCISKVFEDLAESVKSQTNSNHPKSEADIDRDNFANIFQFLGVICDQDSSHNSPRPTLSPVELEILSLIVEEISVKAKACEAELDELHAKLRDRMSQCLIGCCHGNELENSNQTLRKLFDFPAVNHHDFEAQSPHVKRQIRKKMLKRCAVQSFNPLNLEAADFAAVTSLLERALQDANKVDNVCEISVKSEIALQSELLAEKRLKLENNNNNNNESNEKETSQVNEAERHFEKRQEKKLEDYIRRQSETERLAALPAEAKRGGMGEAIAKPQRKSLKKNSKYNSWSLDRKHGLNMQDQVENMINTYDAVMKAAKSIQSNDSDCASFVGSTTSKKKS